MAKDILSYYSVINVAGRNHVVCEARFRGDHPEPNYQGTFKALCGVIDKGHTLEDWKKKHNKL